MSNKKITNSKSRIDEIMNYFNISQSELCRRTGLQKSALSNYLNGDREPRQDQISIIADPFNINPAWLMGYDAPMFMNSLSDKRLRNDEAELLLKYNQLNDSGKKYVKDTIDLAMMKADFLKDSSPAKEGTG